MVDVMGGKGAFVDGQFVAKKQRQRLSQRKPTPIKVKFGMSCAVLIVCDHFNGGCHATKQMGNSKFYFCPPALETANESA